MSSQPIRSFHGEPLTAWATIAGVVIILGLLWAIGAVAQGQVQRAEARAEQAVQAMALRCGAGRSAGCEGTQTAWSAAYPQDASMRPVSVSYR